MTVRDFPSLRRREGVARPEAQAGKVVRIFSGAVWGRSATVLEAPAVIACLDDVVMMGDAIEQRGSHFRIAEDGRPLTEREVGGDDHRGAFVKLADEVKQQLAA